MGEKETVGIVLLGIFVLAIAIIISKILFPFFIALSIISFIVLIIIVIIELSNECFGEISKWVAVAFGIFILLMFATWFIGYGIGGTSFGKASVEIYTQLTGAQQQINQDLQNSINQVVNESCKTLDKEDCNILKNTAKNAKNLQDVINEADKLKSLSKKAKNIK